MMSNHIWREGGSGREEKSPAQLYFFVASRCVKIETKTAVYDTTEEDYVYVFVTTTIST